MLLTDARNSDRATQKSIRDELRHVYQFYITDFTDLRVGFTAEDFENLVVLGKITLV